VNETEKRRLRRALERLVDGQREALEAVRQALDAESAPSEDVLAALEDILEGSLEDARSILGTEEGDGA
jgi:hypothetical protein